MTPKSNSDTMKLVGEDCINFYDLDGSVGVNLVPITPDVYLPRVGERVYLPGDKGSGAGLYDVIGVRHLYVSVAGPKARLTSVQVDVRKK
jgi:hypothetical protein